MNLRRIASVLGTGVLVMMSVALLVVDNAMAELDNDETETDEDEETETSNLLALPAFTQHDIEQFAKAVEFDLPWFLKRWGK